MYKNKTILALIPARGGSKGLLGKNIKPLVGKPLIAWTIEQALASKYLDKVIVSTDDDKIAKISKRYGALVPFMRPKRLATDKAASIDVIFHALDFFKQKGVEFDYLALLEPTSPLRDAGDIDKCARMLIDNRSAKSIVSVAKLVGAHPEFNVIIDKKTDFIRKTDRTTDFNSLRRQELQDIYYFEGTIYISQVKALFEKKGFYHDKTLAYVVPKWKHFEVDDIVDLICIESIVNNLDMIKKRSI